ncbi:protein FimX [Marinobacterium nitratireducens]|uniref:Protein FimX n=1 Tax=Marinobacterium nitratireducens TaxID=518897 RepID=A0A918DX93_9GAMM|nr:EAL domain-containing protein [Marinobacterium nitratireducens]GGO86590.1 protein FimX [Marinobacterium nitratireducens]
MSDANQLSSTGDNALADVDSGERRRLRKNVHILFLGLGPQDTDPIISLLRAARLAPRGRQIEQERDFLEALSERSWDLVICSPNEGELKNSRVLHHLIRLDKDIPVVLLTDDSDCSRSVRGLKDGMRAVVSKQDNELLLLTLQQELEGLETRRQLRLAESRLSDAERRCQELMEVSSHGIACLDGERLVYVNPCFCHLFGHEDNRALINQPFEQLVIAEDREELSEQLRAFKDARRKDMLMQVSGERADGSSFVANLEMEEARYNGQPCILLMIRPDRQFRELQQTAQQDLVTGLYNRQFLEHSLEEVIQHALDGGHDCNLLYISIDQYNIIRSEIGFEGCDQVARDIADLLRKLINRAHLIARPSDDIFIVIFRDPSPDKSVKLARRICEAVADNSSMVNNTLLQVTCSIGITTINDNSPRPEELVSRARLAAESLRNRQGGGNGVKLYTVETQKANDGKTAKMLREAVEAERFRLLFQPVVALHQETDINHYEVLLRLLDPDNREISPNIFLATVDHADLSIQMDRWVIMESLRQLRTELEQGKRNRLFISITGSTLKDKDLVSWLSETLREFRLPADRIVFQLSETDVSSQLPAATEFARAVKELHCHICIKHFGTSTSYKEVIKAIPADYIKIDGSYVQDLANGHAHDKSFRRMVEQLNAMDRVTVAPLVEGTKVMSKLWKSGVNFIQGYYLQPPRERMDYDFFEH